MVGAVSKRDLTGRKSKMYGRIGEFRAAALKCSKDYYSDGSLHQDKIVAAFRIYRNASAGSRLSDFDGKPVDFGITIVGRLALKAENDTWVAADESFPSIDEILCKNLKVMDEDSGESGSILSASIWSLLANDAWVLGGIHARTEFHFASPLRCENLWDERGNRMTVTAREVIGITAFGYRISRPIPKLEAVAPCADDKKAAAASLPAYKKEVQKYQTIEACRKFYETIPESARK
jgi:hypothetical protein